MSISIYYELFSFFSLFPVPLCIFIYMNKGYYYHYYKYDNFSILTNPGISNASLYTIFCIHLQ